MMRDRSYHRYERIRIIEEWSRTGVLAERRRLPIEEQFRERLDGTGARLFMPVSLTYSDDSWYNTQISYLLEAYDALPNRPDIAFDSTWKVFESTATRTARMRSGSAHKITQSLTYLSEHVALDGAVLDSLLGDLPSQTCEYLFKKIITHAADGDGQRVRGRLTGVNDRKDATGARIKDFLTLVEGKYLVPADVDANRKGAMLLRRALAGETLSIEGVEVTLPEKARLRILMSGLLYTARNERYHGEAFSPFYSSAATLRTYTHPHYLFLSTYALVHLMWSRSGESFGPSEKAVERNVIDNFGEAKKLYGRHWTR
ncbi:hypothetical protein [Streptomyces sp. NPDC017993]|uniref:hypothetical protein n=1 Tax=Streptomyces sp. NPDC017993 TaxID=3365027 RepID=UPI0037B144EF